jgi:predicted PhzF superfamily epimerase YddE/YHI9
MTIDTPPSQSFPFSINNAFTDRLEGGNPAAIVRLPSLTALPDATLQTIAVNFNQPMTVFIAPLAHCNSAVDQSTSPGRTTKMARFGIRWFTPQIEVLLCGHGTIAAAAAVFRGEDGAGAGDLTEIRFEATSGKFLVARKVEEDHIEVDLDSETSEGLSIEEDIKIRGILAKALGKNVPVKYTGRGAGHLRQYALIEVDTLELKNVKVNTDAFVSIRSSLYDQLNDERDAICGYSLRVLSWCMSLSQGHLSQVSRSSLGCLRLVLVSRKIRYVGARTHYRRPTGWLRTTSLSVR